MKTRKQKYTATKVLGQFKWLLLFALTTSVAVGARAGAQLDIFTGEAQAKEVLESQHTASLPEPSPTQTPTPSPTTTVTPPKPTPSPAVEAVVPTGGAGELEELINKHFGEHAEDAKKILECENRSWNVRAVNHNRNGSRDLGLFQLNDRYWGGEENFDPETNIKKAKMIFDRANQTWKPWTCAYQVNQKSYLNQ